MGIGACCTSRTRSEPGGRSGVELAWHLVEAQPFLPGWHVDLVCRELERVARGENRRLLINIPPRHGKSLLAAVLFPAWVWITWLERRFLFASYARDYAERDGALTRDLISSSWYQERYGHVFSLLTDQNEKWRFVNSRGGQRLAASVGGQATGAGGDIVIVDDPLKIEDSHSDLRREAVVDWFMRTASTRLNDPTSGAFVVIGQRVHEADLFGHLLEKKRWRHLCLPAEYEPEHPYLFPEDPRTRAGEELWPQRVGREQLEEFGEALGAAAFAALMQQRPSPAGGTIFDPASWRWYDPREGRTYHRILISWDLSFKATHRSDYTVGQVWGIRGEDRYLLHQCRGRLSFPETVEVTKRLSEEFRPESGRPPETIIEEAASGPALIAMVREGVPAVRGVRPERNKVARAHAVSPLVESGRVFLPGAPNAGGTGFDPGRTPQWVQEFVEEFTSFPHVTHDDSGRRHDPGASPPQAPGQAPPGPETQVGLGCAVNRRRPRRRRPVRHRPSIARGCRRALTARARSSHRTARPPVYDTRARVGDGGRSLPVDSLAPLPSGRAT